MDSAPLPVNGPTSHPAHNEENLGVQDPWAKEKSPSPYAPLLSTLRLYAGWVFAWGLAALTFVAYGHTRKLPFSIVFLDAFGNLSSLILITSAAFLFLFITSMHRALKGKILLGIFFLLLWIAAVFFFQQNI